MPHAGRASFDWLVLTAANTRQAAAYEGQLRDRFGGDRGVSGGDRVGRAFAIADARDARIGSGAATVLALAEVARRLLHAKRARSLAELFRDERILILHSGGDSRRLPMYAVEGKIFAPIPRSTGGGACAGVLDLLIDDLASLAPRAGGEVLVGAGDAVIGLARDPVRFEGAGVIGVAQKATAERASRHGVFVRGRGDEVAAFLQKPDRHALRAAGALGRDGRALVDLGLFSFDPASIAALLAGAGVRLRAGRVTFVRGGLADRASRAELPSIDLYREIAMALPRRASRAQYLATCAGGARKDLLARPLGALFDAMRRTDFRVEVADVGDFLHIGSMREMLDALCGPKAEIARFGVEPGSLPLPALEVVKGGSAADPVVLDARVARARVAKGRAIIDAGAIVEARLGGENIVCGVRADRLVLPEGIALFRLAVERARGRAVRGRDSTQSVHVACGIDDDFKTRLDAGGTFLGRPFEAFLRSARIEARDVVAGDGTLWDARLWVVDDAAAVEAGDPHRALEWMWQGGRAPEAWRNARRISLGDIVAHGDGMPRSLARAMSVADLSESHPAIALACAARDGSLASLHRGILRRSAASRRAIVANEAALPVRMIASPLARAHALATMSCVAASLGRSAERSACEFRAQAFAAVGEAVLSRIELPARPVRAAILEDQAVWTSTPVRVDLAGGWTDTPPICNAVGGSVVNVAVTLRGQLPIQVVAKLDEVPRGEEPAIRITSTDLGETRVVRTTADLAQRSDPTRWSSLAENALVLTGAAPADPKASLAKWLRAVGGGISLTMFSAVPKGSGLGTSSILGAATIQCLDRVFGRERSPEALFAATSALEQMLSTRGGWQDQVGGVVGGFKLAQTSPGGAQLPTVERLAVPTAFARAIAERSVLYFTGQRRMAKNILENVVWNHLTHEPRAIEAVAGLRENAPSMRGAILRGDMASFEGELDRYMRLKRQIDPGSSPPMFDALARRWRRDLAAWCFAGAGGGGFMLLVAKDARSAERLRADIARNPQHPRARAFDLEVDDVGVRCAVL